MARRREAYTYGCLMAKLPAPLADRVRAFSMTVPDERLAVVDGSYGPGGREDDPHVTLKYGLKTADPDDVMAVLEGVEPFEVTLGRCGVFHNPEYVVMKLGASGRGLYELNRKVSAHIPNVDSHGEYRPHVTVAYLEKDETDPYYYRAFQDESLEGERFAVDSLEFTTPAGNRYVLPLNGRKSRAARRVASAERVAIGR